MKHKRTTAVDIPLEVKRAVNKRDKGRCIYCYRPIPYYFSNSHFIKRSQGGLGIEQNIVTACYDCHTKYDFGGEHKRMYEYTLRYLEKIYGQLDISKLKYNKWEELQ